jgi:hypothetical protein
MFHRYDGPVAHSQSRDERVDATIEVFVATSVNVQVSPHRRDLHLTLPSQHVSSFDQQLDRCAILFMQAFFATAKYPVVLQHLRLRGSMMWRVRNTSRALPVLRALERETGQEWGRCSIPMISEKMRCLRL